MASQSWFFTAASILMLQEAFGLVIVYLLDWTFGFHHCLASQQYLFQLLLVTKLLSWMISRSWFGFPSWLAAVLRQVIFPPLSYLHILHARKRAR